MVGGPPDDLVALDDLNDFCNMLVALGRAVPAHKWVDELAALAELEFNNNVVGPC